MIVAGPLDLTLIRGCTFEAQTFTMQGLDGITPVDISGMIPTAQVRMQSGDPVIIDLQPAVTDGPNGIITTPEISQDVTPQFIANVYEWDLILNDPVHDDTQQILFGKFYVRNKVTNSG
jgi:hypothetical protein